METTAAVKDLRTRLGDTQQSFAQRIGSAISTAVRYETNRPPSGEALWQLHSLAKEHRFEDLAQFFLSTFYQENGIDLATMSGRDSNRDIHKVEEPLNEKERAGRALGIAAVRFEKHLKTFPAFRTAVLSVADEIATWIPASPPFTPEQEALRDLVAWADSWFRPDPNLQLQRLAHERMKEKRLLYGEARQQIENEQPELYKLHLESLGLTPETAPKRNPPIIGLEIEGEKISLRPEEPSESMPVVKTDPAGKPKRKKTPKK